ncbi:MAG TPA: peptidylprolyl isomerase [Candidatus Acidoferrales bacterium]|nr:peptidylprolyl isomerase [Candidatus Acidoferrales bacterium]
MKLSTVFLLLGVSLPIWAQTPPPQPPKPAAAPTLDGGVTTPLQISPQSMTTLPKDKVVVRVNDVKITAGQLDEILEAYPENTRVFVRGPGRQQFIDNLVRTLVLSQEGKRRKLDEDSAYKTQAQYSLAAILATHASEEIRKNVQVDDAALMKYYEDHKSEYLKVRARHILIRMTGSPVPVKPGQKDLTDAEALAKAQELRAKIQAGADFAALAKTESDDTGSGANGGELGFFGHGQMVPSFEQAAFKLKPGELSEPVKSPFGYHLIQVEEQQTRTLAELKPEIEPKVRPELAKKQVDDMVNKANVILDPDFLPASKTSK